MPKKLQIPIADFDLTEEPGQTSWEYSYFKAKGFIDLLITQNAEDVFEFEVLDYAGCAGWLQEGIGLDYAITSGYLGVDQADLKEGAIYRISGITVNYYRGDGWEIDDDEEWNFEDLTRIGPSRVKQLFHKIKMVWWRQVGYKIKRKY